MVGMCQENIRQPVLTVLYAFRNPLLIVRWFSTHLLHAASQDLSCQERSSSCDLFKSASEPKFPGECVLISFEPPAQRSDQHLANSPDRKTCPVKRDRRAATCSNPRASQSSQGNVY